MPVCLTACVRQLDEYFNGTRKEFSIQLDLRGTEFQKRVWQELLNIPFGTTTAYLKVASSLGDKKALRAVGRANGQNPIVILVPCHRVIGTDGSLTGYGGGLWRKEWLLNFEGSRLQPGLLTARPWVIDASRR
jgi:methylated-DNA-[protein]-cysteine S-methyltransferase